MELYPKFTDKGWHKCDNCEEVWHGTALKDIEDLSERIEPGGVVPSGECPVCQALCYPCTNAVVQAKGYCNIHKAYVIYSEDDDIDCPACEFEINQMFDCLDKKHSID